MISISRGARAATRKDASFELRQGERSPVLAIQSRCPDGRVVRPERLVSSVLTNRWVSRDWPLAGTTTSGWSARMPCLWCSLPGTITTSTGMLRAPGPCSKLISGFCVAVNPFDYHRWAFEISIMLAHSVYYREFWIGFIVDSSFGANTLRTTYNTPKRTKRRLKTPLIHKSAAIIDISSVHL